MITAPVNNTITLHCLVCGWTYDGSSFKAPIWCDECDCLAMVDEHIDPDLAFAVVSELKPSDDRIRG